MRIGTWNLRGIISEDRKQHLANDLHTYKLHILTVQETHLRGTDQIQLPAPNNTNFRNNTERYTLYHTGPENSSHHGVGIIVRNDCNAHFNRINDRICTLTVDLEQLTGKDKNRKLTVISAYAPTLTNSIKNPELAEEFYNNLEITINSIPKRNLIFIGADTNAQLGINNTNFRGSVGSFGKGYLNSNGERLGDFLIRNNLIATNTFFQHKLKHRVTWTHPNINPQNLDSRTKTPRRNPYRNQIDFILTKQDFRSEITDSRSYHGTTLESDHNIVICDSNIKWNRVFKQKNNNKSKHTNLENLGNPIYLKKYKTAVENKLKELPGNAGWEEVGKLAVTAGEETLGTAQRKKNFIINDELKKLSEKKLKLRRERESCQNETLSKKKGKEIGQIKAKTDKIKKRETEKSLLNLILDVEKNSDDSRRMHAANRILNNKEGKSIIVVEDKEGIVHNPQKKVEIITHFFETSFKQEKTEKLPEIKPQELKNPITAKEVKEATKKLKNNKSTGCDNIKAELIKYGPDALHAKISEILNEAASTGESPKEIKLGQLIPLPKPGKPKGPVKNLRPIILLSILRKILAIIIVNRTFDRIRKEIDISQAAYSPGRSTTELVFTFKILTELALCSKDLEVHLLMLDMSKAFDTIDRGTLLTDLSEILEPDELHLVSLLLTDVQLQVKHDNIIGKTFTPDIGSPQGDCASPIWFIFYLHKALLKYKTESARDIKQDIAHDHTYVKHEFPRGDERRIEPKKSQNKFCIAQQYADDTSWITTEKHIKDNIKKEVPTVLRAKNLLVNEDKTEEFTVSREGDTEWKKCRFLGSLLGNEEDIKRRKQLACAAFHKNKTSLCSNKISLKTRIRIFSALVTSIALYNSELWSLTSKDIKKIDTFQRAFLRQIVRNRRISNIRLYELCELVPWSLDIKKRRLTWFGHMHRLPETAPAKKAFHEATAKKVNKVSGGQRTTWIKTIEKDFKQEGKDITEAANLAKQRETYAQLVNGAMERSLADKR